MYSFIISGVLVVLVGILTTRDLGFGWGVFCGVTAGIIVQIVIGLLIRKKVNKINENLQGIMQSAQVKINRQMTQFQQRPVGSVKTAQQILEKIQRDAVLETLAATSQFDRYYRWNYLLKKQINTMKMQLRFQLKEFDAVDLLLPKCFLLDARSLAIKLVRMFKKSDPKLDKFYQRKCAKFKGEDAAFLACLYAWIKLRQNDEKAALDALIKAKKVSDNPVLLENYERLVNGKAKLFNNANLGDLWYSLYLEEPKVKPQRDTRQRMF